MGCGKVHAKSQEQEIYTATNLYWFPSSVFIKDCKQVVAHKTKLKWKYLNDCIHTTLNSIDKEIYPSSSIYTNFSLQKSSFNYKNVIIYNISMFIIYQSNIYKEKHLLNSVYSHRGERQNLF